MTAIVLFSFGASPLMKIAQLQSPRAHSFNQSLSWPYIFAYYGSFSPENGEQEHLCNLILTWSLAKSGRGKTNELICCVSIHLIFLTMQSTFSRSVVRFNTWIYPPPYLCLSSTTRCMTTHFFFYLHKAWQIQPLIPCERTLYTWNYATQDSSGM